MEDKPPFSLSNINEIKINNSKVLSSYANNWD